MEYYATKGARIPRIGLGTYELKGDTCRDIVGRALELGYRHIDTAQIYGNETEVGEAIANSGIDRNDIWVTTKVWYDKLFPDSFIDSVVASLDRLQFDRVDLLLVHWPHPEVPIRDYITLLQQARDANMADHIGVSNFTPSQLESALRLVPELITDQVEYHAMLSQENVLTTCRQHDMFLTAYSPIGQGEIPDHPLLSKIGQPYGKSAAQVGLRWLLQQDDVVIIPRTSNPDRLTENQDIFDFSLTADEMTSIHRISVQRKRIVNPGFAPQWEG